jgi:hypothetical protein
VKNLQNHRRYLVAFALTVASGIGIMGFIVTQPGVARQLRWSTPPEGIIQSPGAVKRGDNNKPPKFDGDKTPEIGLNPQPEPPNPDKTRKPGRS